MARKASSNEVHARGFSDIIGIVLISVSVLALVALFSYDRNDVPVNRTDPNVATHNWIGQVGAWLGFALFFVLGASAYLLPILLACFGLSYLFQLMAYFHRRWVWAAVLLVCCMGLLDLNTSQDALTKLAKAHDAAGAGFLDRTTYNLGAPSAGGWIGLMLNKYLFGHFGSVGATIIFVTLYLISLLFLTNFQLGEWLRGLLKPLPAEAETDLSAEEKALERRARDLERQAKKLQEQVAKAGLGADLQPVPEPTVRDLSVPQAKPFFRSATKPKTRGTEPETEAPPGAEGDVIPAKEIAAATTPDVLGKTKDKTREPKSEPSAPAAREKTGENDKGVVVDEKTAVETPPVVH